MRLPAPTPPDGPGAPTWESAVDFLHALTGVTGINERRYLAWDDFRFRPVPDTYTHEQWWSVIRFRRRDSARHLDLLRTSNDRAFSYVLADEVLEAVDRITRTASGQIGVEDDIANPSTRNRYVVSSLIEEAITSSQLEGATTSRRVAKDLLKSGRAPRDRSERMILNNYRAMQYVGEHRHEKITPERVFELHRLVTAGTLDNPNAAGRLQTLDDDRVSVWSHDGLLLHSPPPAEELSERLARLCRFANGEHDGAYIPPVLRALAVHFMFGYDHYFEDGNGRTARAAFYWVMLREGFWLTEFITVSRLLKRAPSKYARSYLLTELDDGDLTHFFIYHLGIISRAIQGLHDYLDMKTREMSQLKAVVSDRHAEFNHRQLALLEHALRHPDTAYTVHSHSMSHHVSGETARKDMTDLAKRGLLTQQRRGKHFAWRPAPDLADQLRADTD
ncbi:Fic family protein [Nocardioides daejeonensis]|uniref:Fic family protein n=1 Tax=Nocardioides daejeonensis TaxID=1046556 RepID=UPI000D7483DF|nr:Fic family protein [Nocardioides daejeonensis]